MAFYTKIIYVFRETAKVQSSFLLKLLPFYKISKIGIRVDIIFRKTVPSDKIYMKKHQVPKTNIGSLGRSLLSHGHNLKQRLYKDILAPFIIRQTIDVFRRSLSCHLKVSLCATGWKAVQTKTPCDSQR